jgi:hypothetical protein
METLKKPETIITLINTAGLLGATVYFHRRINGVEQEIDKYTENLIATVKKVQEMQITKQHVKQLAEAIRDLNNAMGAQSNELNYLRNLSSFQRDQIKELQSHSKESGNECKLTQDPFQQQNRYNQNGYSSPSQYSQLGMNSQSHYQPQTQPQPQPQPQPHYQPGMNSQPHSQIQPPGQYRGRICRNPGPSNQYSQYNQPGYNSGYSQPQPSNYNQGPISSDLLDLSGYSNGSTETVEDDNLDSEIAAVRNARQNGEMNSLGL